MNWTVTDSLGTMFVCDNSLVTMKSVIVKNIKSSQGSLYSILHFMQGTTSIDNLTFSGATAGYLTMPYISFQS